MMAQMMELDEVKLQDASDDVLEQGFNQKPAGGYTANIPQVQETWC